MASKPASRPRDASTDIAAVLGDVRLAGSSPIWSQVHAIVRNAITGLHLPPGRNLSEKEIAAALGVSRTPAREAFIRLSEEGLVDIYPQYGTFVAPIRMPAVLEAQFIRDSLECSIARQVAESADRRLVDELKALIKGQLRAARAGDHQTFYLLDEKMHETFSVACGREGVWDLIQSTKVHVDRVRHLMLPRDLRFRSLVDEHEAIVDAIARHEPDAAAAAMHEHLEGVLRGLDDIRGRYPDYFENEQVRGRPSRQMPRAEA
jgi:DNA-binding GntR family transcriptional regulator